MRIYFAGKMPYMRAFTIVNTDAHLFEMSAADKLFVETGYELHDWRWEIIPNLAACMVHVEQYKENDPDELEYLTGERERSLRTVGGHEYAGPFYKTEYQGHGNYEYVSGIHGHEDAAEQNIDEPIDWRMHKTFMSCSCAIHHADIVFAWVEDFDLFGTFCELGMAHAWGKPIVIATPNNLDCQKDIWFPLRSATYRIYADTAGNAFNDFLINHAPAVATDLATRKAKETEGELNRLKQKITQIGDGRSAAWRELIKELK